MPRSPERRPGFTLAELIAVMVIVALLASVALAHVVGNVRRGRVGALAGNLDALNEAILAYRGDTGRYPRTLLLLTTAPTPGDTDLCGRTLPADIVGRWRGPYLQRSLTASGLPSGDAAIRIALERNPPTLAGGRFATLFIVVDDVDRAIAAELNVAFDGDADLNGGAILWTAISGERGTLRYGIPIRGC